MTARQLAHSLLQKAEKQKQYSNIALDKALCGAELSEPDSALCAAIFYGVTERKLTLDYRISALSARPIDTLDAQTLTALRMGLYQLIYLDRIPPHAAINETVSLCAKKSAGFVNAVLRAHTRTEETPLPDRLTDTAGYLSVRFSVIPALCEKFLGIFGLERTESILEAFSKNPQTTIRVNTLKISRDGLQEKINDSSKTAISDDGLRVKGAVRSLYGFEDGLFFVQDEASQLCVKALEAKRGETVVDVCSCPGSKSFGAAIDMQNEGKLLSFDLHQNKLPLISSGAQRLGISIIQTGARDGRTPCPELSQSADRVICDVPCSGFGVLAKKPELRYKNPTESIALPDIQLDILDNASNYVKVGGRLVYSTCTLFPEENEENIARFLNTHKDFELTPFKAGKLDCQAGMITLAPDTHGTDGFFIAVMTRKEIL